MKAASRHLLIALFSACHASGAGNGDIILNNVKYNPGMFDAQGQPTHDQRAQTDIRRRYVVRLDDNPMHNLLLRADRSRLQKKNDVVLEVSIPAPGKAGQPFNLTLRLTNNSKKTLFFEEVNGISELGIEVSDITKGKPGKLTKVMW